MFVANYPWEKSDKKSMEKILEFKNVADDVLHSPISDKEDYFGMDNLPQSNRINRLINEATISKRGHLSELLNKKLYFPVKKESDIAISLEEDDRITWANYYVGRRIWPSFRLVINIDNFRSNKPDFVSASLIAKDNDGIWEGKYFEFESSKEHGDYSLGRPYKIQAHDEKKVSVFISNNMDESRKTMPDIDRDTLVLVVKTKSGKEFKYRIKPAFIRQE